MKTCSRCNKSLPLQSFWKQQRSKDGLNPACSSCLKDKQKHSYRDNSIRREQVRNQAKKYQNKVSAFVMEQKSKPCVDCGIKYPYYVMDFDHVKGEKVGNIGSMKSSLLQAKLEIAKCEVVCSNCHRERTHIRRLQAL